MIKEITEKDSLIIRNILKNHFGINDSIRDPYGKWFLYQENEFLGFINYSIIYERAELNYIYVLPLFRGKNIASNLIKFMLADLKKNRVETVSLEVNINNSSAIKLYEKFGFYIVSVRKQYYKNEDAYVMVKEVGD